MQEIVVYVVIGLALWVALRYLWKRTGKKDKNNCGSCDDCPLKKHCSQNETK